MNLRKLFFDYNLDHIVVALPVQFVCAAALFLLGAPVGASMVGGAMAASWGFYCRELAQYEYLLENTVGYDPHTFWCWQFWLARNPFVWPQLWDWLAPTIAVALAAAGAYL